MKLYGRIFYQGRIVKEKMTVPKYEDRSFHDQLEECFVELCRELDSPVPLWMNKNTNEFASYRKTDFDREQFIENVWFDRMLIWIEDI